MARGLRYDPPAGPWFQRTVATIEGVLDGVPVRIDHFVVNPGKYSHLYTRIVGTPVEPLPSRVVVCHTSELSGIDMMQEMLDVNVGDARRHPEFAIIASDDGDARSLLEGDILAALFNFRRSALTFRVGEGKVTLHWSNLEENTDILDAGCRLVCSACRWRRPERIAGTPPLTGCPT